jgi:hypothetical protein
MRENRYSFYSTSFGSTLLLRTSGGELDVTGLFKELLVHPEGEFFRIINWNFGVVAISQHYRIVGTIQRDIVSGISHIRYSNTLDHTHTTGVDRIQEVL